MFEPGSLIHYSTCGLCLVEEVTQLQMAGADKERPYYRLRPLDQSRGVIYTPVDNQKVTMRKAMNRQEAEALIEKIPKIDELQIEEEKQREQGYRTALLSADCVLWVRVIKTIYHRKQDRLRHGKKATATEERYLVSATNLLHKELAQAMGMQPDEMEEYIKDRVQEI